MPATGEWQSSWSVVQTAFPLLTCQIFAGESPAQCVSGCCPLPRSHQPLRDTQLSHGKRISAAGLACTLVQWNGIPSEIPAGQSSTRKDSWSSGVSPTTPTQGLALLRKLQPPEGDYTAPKCCGLWFSLTAVCMPAVSAAAFLPRVCVCFLIRSCNCG